MAEKIYEIYTDDSGSFTVGSIAAQNDEDIVIRGVDEEGKISAYYALPVKTITEMISDTPYLNKISRYMEYAGQRLVLAAGACTRPRKTAAGADPEKGVQRVGADHSHEKRRRRPDLRLCLRDRERTRSAQLRGSGDSKGSDASQDQDQGSRVH